VSPGADPRSGSGQLTWAYRPLIAVVAYHLGPTRVSRWPDGGFGVPAPYLDALRRSGARTAIVAPGEEGDPEQLLEPFDGLLLAGGGDVDPARYGGATDDEHVYGVEPDRDDLEVALLLAAVSSLKPVLCICRGMQVLNVAYGGTLHPHLPDVPGLLTHGVPLDGTETVHDVIPEPGSRLSATTKSLTPLACASHHHQGVDVVGDGLVVTGRSPDGLVEAVEVATDPAEDPTFQPWVMGVQWHPEETAATDPAQQALFDGLALVARIGGTRPKAGGAGRGRDYHVADPDPAWPDHFEAEAARISAALPPGLLTRIDHVGSTSVPGLAAKPIIDIQLSLTTLAPREPYVEPICELDYRWVLDPWDDAHEYFSRDIDGVRSFHLHVCLTGSEWERRHLAFRDRLRADPDIASAYGELKRRLAAEHPRDTIGYTEAKTAFIEDVESGGRTDHPERTRPRTAIVG